MPEARSRSPRGGGAELKSESVADLICKPPADQRRNSHTPRLLN